MWCKQKCSALLHPLLISCRGGNGLLTDVTISVGPCNLDKLQGWQLDPVALNQSNTMSESECTGIPLTEGYQI